jgi:cytochrome c peroxidase
MSRKLLIIGILTCISLLTGGTCNSLRADPISRLFTLPGVTPRLPDMSFYVRDETALRELGKALFWDINAGSDGIACASCHYAAGADIRIKNAVNPGHDDTFDQRDKGKGSFGPNVQLQQSDFPFHKLRDPLNPESTVLFHTNDRAGSAGSFSGIFKKTTRQSTENCRTKFDPENPFHTRTRNPDGTVTRRIYRKVEPRHTPSVINAVFNFRNFWDGRASNVFNGLNPFGKAFNDFDSNAGIVVSLEDGIPFLEKMELENASLASQSLGPPTSNFEMSCAGRGFADIGRKLIKAMPLSTQIVHPQDDILGPLRNPSGLGLNVTYRDLIRKAFWPAYWRDLGEKGPYKVTGGQVVKVTPPEKGFNIMELNFSMFWGLSIMSYEATLISDQAPFDSNFETNQVTTDTPEARGQRLFVDKGRCVNCHKGPLLSGAATNTVQPLQVDPSDLVEQMPMGNGLAGLYDHGFYNVGVTPTIEDLGVANTITLVDSDDPDRTLTYSLSFSRQLQAELLGDLEHAPERIKNRTTPCSFEIPFFPDDCESYPTNVQDIKTMRLAVDGSFKEPGLRNVGLTPPYMHNGGFSNLHQVIEFYNRGGNKRSQECLVDTPSGRIAVPGNTTQSPDREPDPNGIFMKECDNFDNDVLPLGLSPQEEDDLVAFLLSLTDNRVACQSGPFNHPSLPIPNGHPDDGQPLSTGEPTVPDIIATLPATGIGGLPAEGKPCFPNTGDLFGEMQQAFRKITR